MLYADDRPAAADSRLLASESQPALRSANAAAADAQARAQLAWRATAKALAAGGRVRVSRDGGRSYPRSRERALPPAPPLQPAAVRIYDEQGLANCLPADFDVARGGQQQVDRDLARLKALVERCGGRVITDRSPNGGAHLYVPWQQAVPFQQLRRLMQALSPLLPTLDVQPAINVLSGCLRPPGSRHKSGGWQELITPLDEARHIAENKNPAAVWHDLQRYLTPQAATAKAASCRPTSGHDYRPQGRPTDSLGLSLPPGAAGGAGPHERRAHLAQVPGLRRRALSTETLRIAQHGEYDQTRYATPSQARQRVLAAAAGAGWSFRDLREHLETGRWPGLTAFYDRYQPRHRSERLAADWCSAVSWVHRQPAPPKTGTRSTHKSHTREPITHRGQKAPSPSVTKSGLAAGAVRSRRTRQSSDEYRFVRTWWNAARRLERVRHLGRQGLTRRLLLRALANAAQKAGSRYLEFGCRSLSLAMGVDYSTAAAALRALRSEEDPMLVLLEDRRGVRGDLYELVIPACVQDSIDRRPWAPGSIEAIHPVFRALGLPVAFLYEQLGKSPLSSFDLADAALISHRAAQAGLKVLGAHGLAARANSGWIRTTQCLDNVARTVGVTELIDTLQTSYRQQRDAWQALLQAYSAPPHSPRHAKRTRSSYGALPRLPLKPTHARPAAAPPAETPLQLVCRVLGARILEPAFERHDASGVPSQAETPLVPGS